MIPGLDSFEEQTFGNQTFEVHSISNEVVAFGAREPDDTDVPTGRVLARGVNEQGLYVATRSGDIVVLVDKATLVPGTNQTFETFGEAQLDETTLGLFGAFEATFASGFGIYEKRGAGPLSVVIDHSTPLPGGDSLTTIESFAFSTGQVVFHGIGASQEGIYLSNEVGVSVLADRSTSIPADVGTFQSFGEVAFDKGNAVFVGRGRSSEVASKQNLHQQVGIYVSLDGRLEKVVDMQPNGQPEAFAGRTPVELSIGPEAISGNRVVFYAAFSDGTDGIFTVEFDSQSRHDVSLSPGILISDLDFGRRPLPGQIRGQSYNDINRNGRRDVDEPGLPGWIVYLDENRNGLFDTGEPSTATGETGEYRFTDLPALRNYTVRQAPQANWVESASFGSQYQFFLDANERRNDVDFGNRATAIDGQGGSGKIYVEVFDDRNANGERDSDEGLRVGRDLYIDVNNNGIFDRGIDASPEIVGDVYEFSELAMVSHEIRLRRTDGLEQTSPLGNSFDTSTKSNVGDRPTAVVTGHFDDDDLVDLVVGNNTSNTLTFLSNANSPAAVTSSIDHRGNGPIAMVVDDFDRDGRLDLAVANFHSSDVSVLLGNGDGTFQNAAVYSVGEKAGPVAISTAYLNDDPFPDLVVSNSSSDSVTLLTNSGTGGFRATHLTIGIGDRPQGIIAGKFTSDNFDDMLVVAQNDNAVRFVLNNGNNTFAIGQAIAVEARPSAIVAGDFDSDGFLDFAVANISTASVSVLFGTGDGQFERKQNIRVDASPIALAQVDIDSDNDIDIVFTRGGDLPVSLLRNDGTGQFQSSAFGGAADFLDVSALPFSISASDINGDGVVDLVLANRDSDSVTFFENRIVAGSHRVTLGTNQPEQSVSFGIVLEIIRDLPGDVNQDGAVNFGDFLIFSQNFGQQNVGWVGGDFDEDGVVTFFDFLVFSANFGRSLNAARRS